jgi:hypothetical protein
METRLAASLRLGDAVLLAPGDVRIVRSPAFHDKPIDSNGTTGIRVEWFDHDHANLIAADKTMVIVHDDEEVSS